MHMPYTCMSMNERWDRTVEHLWRSWHALALALLHSHAPQEAVRHGVGGPPAFVQPAERAFDEGAKEGSHLRQLWAGVRAGPTTLTACSSAAIALPRARMPDMWAYHWCLAGPREGPLPA